MDKQHGDMDMDHGHEELKCSMEMQHEHAVLAYREDLQKRHVQ